MKIYKYKLRIVDEQILSLPDGYKILAVNVQRDDPFIWCLVDPDNPKVDVKFFTFGTGHEIDDTIFLNYIGTYYLLNARLVYHVFTQDG